ncbi:hypothetical protein ILUMI_22932 [Ignelater luminosus]|uniref:Uncharacterized protein n=1 Tax=Ignelater luminosus TaxID=2038154 RepID=A0A8K0G2E6_IGNLU|nr:hypothetical protein ILUMI_22932 [Ignelater luminosus]
MERKEPKKEKACSYKLKEDKTRALYQFLVTQKAAEIPSWEQEMNQETVWENFKEILRATAQELCGSVPIGGKKRKAVWWCTEELKLEVATKNEMWKTYHQRKTTESYNTYKLQRNKAEEIADRWTEYFEELLEDIENKRKKGRTREENVISEKELEKALQKTNPGKSAGEDQLTREMFKFLNKEGKQKLLGLPNKIRIEEIMPNDWKIGILIPIYV